MSDTPSIMESPLLAFCKGERPDYAEKIPQRPEAAGSNKCDLNREILRLGFGEKCEKNCVKYRVV